MRIFLVHLLVFQRITLKLKYIVREILSKVEVVFSYNEIVLVI